MAEFDLLHSASIVLTLVVLEAVLSFDNAAILAVMSRKLPLGEGRRRALNYGLGIAYVLRIIAILLAVQLVKYPLFLTVGGAYLALLFLKHFGNLVSKKKGHGHEAPAVAKSPPKRLFGLSAFQVVIFQIGLIDLAFALDQVVAAVAFTTGEAYSTALIFIAASVGLVSLRILAPYISRLMDWLPLLEHMAYVAVGFVGALLVAETLSLEGGLHLIHHGSGEHPLFHIEKGIKIAVTLSLFAIPMLVKLIFKWPRSNPGEHTMVEKAVEGARPIEAAAQAVKDAASEKR